MALEVYFFCSFFVGFNMAVDNVAVCIDRVVSALYGECFSDIETEVFLEVGLVFPVLFREELESV